ncbi:hypothetical protein NEMBOFW57_004556 [Staphylotrichum longicolle]|uniref:Uncharacterized protein n=1 Tax=Staphylotrichum longicolle TaxID=669026 RepID=A0AAD4I3R7_9PEZI|nr:hypothetical protein NEMBOFW57_004556 [Staphylotrichum longicolle]
MVALKTLAAAALVAQGVLASPAQDPQLAKRGEGIHLLNCRPYGGAGVAQTWLSLVVYCANDSDCSNLSYSPSSNNVCVKGTSTTSEAYHVWEGGSQSCTFPSGVKFTWNIPSNAQSQANYSPVGSGSNGYRSFAGYKDDHGATFGYNYHSCEKIYYYI